MKLLNIVKSDPDTSTLQLIEALSEENQATVFRLFDDPVDYEALIELIFAHDKVISWW